MTTYNTGNPIGSTDARDLYDNAQNFDTAVNTSNPVWVDRLGNARTSLVAAAGFVIDTPWLNDSDFATLEEADAAAAAANKRLAISTVWAVATTTTLTSAIKILPGGGFNGVGALTINGPFEAGSYQVFTGTNAVTFGADSCREVYPEWWGIDGVADDVEIQKALNATSNNAKVLLAGKTYEMAAGITVRAGKHVLHGAKSTLDYSAIAGDFDAITINGDAAATEPYGKSLEVLSGLKLIGNTAGTGILYSGTSTNISPSHSYINNVSISLFSVGIEVGANAYLISHNNVEVYRCTTCISEPSGLTNYGENISFFNSCFYNSGAVLNHANANGDMYFFGCSFDYCGVDGATMFTITGGRINTYGCHLEFGNSGTPVTATVFVVSGDQSRFAWSGGEMIGNTSYMTCDYVFNIGSGSSMTVSGARMLFIVAAISLRTGTGRLVLNDIEYGNTPSVSAMIGSADNVLKDPSFEATAIQDMIYIASDTATITNRFTGTNVALSISNVVAASGVNSLRVAKAGGSGYAATIGIAAPVSKGERVALRFKCLNNNNRGANNLSVSAVWATCTGSDANGVPIISNGASYSAYNFTPTNVWTQFSGSSLVNGADAAAAPPWATHAVFLLNLFNFAGGTGAPEGGNYSIYFDELEIYKQ